MKRALASLAAPLRRQLRRADGDPDRAAPEAVHPLHREVERRLAGARTIVDLGCGNNPVAGATAAVDLHVEPEQRLEGAGPRIDTAALGARGIRFVESRIDAALPFADDEFDLAYSHHVFEHLEDPATACREMMRIARSGIVITPSYLAELIFGRPYHRWMVMEYSRKLFFFQKRSFEDRPFGNHPLWDESTGRWVASEATNPFDMLLDDGGWYDGRFGQMPLLADKLAQHWHSHSPLLETTFIWDDSFDFEIVAEGGE